MLRAILIAIGSEVTSGATVDTNSAFLSRELFSLGVEVIEHVAVKDDPSHIIQTLQQALKRVPIIITTGGLGPTFDDITKGVLSQFSGCPSVFNPRQLGRIRAYFRKRKRKVHSSARAQAFFPKGCVIFDNSVGVAAGFGFKKNGAWIMALPGVPSEMEAMFDEEIAPFIAKTFPSKTRFKSIAAKIIGVSEVEVLKKLGPKFPPRDETVSCGIYPAAGEVTLRMTFRSADSLKIQSAVRFWGKYLQMKLGINLISLAGESLEGVVGNLLAAKRRTLAVAESVTGGFIAKRITDIAGASRYLKGGVVAYSNDVKIQLLGLDQDLLDRYSAVSKQTAYAMAESVRKRFCANWGLSVTGYAGPSGSGKSGAAGNCPVGTVFIGLSDGKKTRVVKYLFQGSRDRIRWLASQAALALLRKFLVNG